MSYGYDANGEKHSVTHTSSSGTSVTEYCDNVIYRNGSPAILLTEIGYYSFADGRYHTYIRDWQGNNRVVLRDDGLVEELNDYYASGCRIGGADEGVQPYKYSGKELDTFGDLNWYDFGARHYDPVLMRWTTTDPLSEKYYGISPYAFCNNDPVNYVDLDGMDWYSTSEEIQDENGMVKEVTKYHWTDAKSQEEMYGLWIEGAYLGETVVVFNGYYDEKLGKDGTLTGEGAKAASVTVYGPNGADDIGEYTGFTMSSDPSLFGVVANGKYPVNRTEKLGPFDSPWAVNDRAKVPALNDYNPAYPHRIPGYLDGVFVHRNNIGEFTGTFYHNKKQRIAGISEGCLIVSQKDWEAFSSQLSTVNNYHLIISRK